MVEKVTTFLIVALCGLGSFIVAVVFLIKGAHAELITLVFAPVAGICLAIIMHYTNIDVSMTIVLVAKDGRFSLTFKRA